VKSKSRESGKCKVRECEGEGGRGWGTRGGGRDKARKSRQGKKIQAMHLRIFNVCVCDTVRVSAIVCVNVNRCHFVTVHIYA
jgi:hypothetical protein